MLLFCVQIGYVRIQMRERTGADIHTTQTGVGRDRCIIQRGLNHGGEHSAFVPGKLDAS